MSNDKDYPEVLEEMEQISRAYNPRDYDALPGEETISLED